MERLDDYAAEEVCMNVSMYAGRMYAAVLHTCVITHISGHMTC